MRNLAIIFLAGSGLGLLGCNGWAQTNADSGTVKTVTATAFTDAAFRERLKSSAKLLSKYADVTAFANDDNSLTSLIGGSARWGKVFDDPQFRSNVSKLALSSSQLGTFVYNGKDDDQNRFPDCVAVGNETKWFCSGTLVAANVVVTAGHCLDPLPTRIALGPLARNGPFVSVASHASYGPFAKRHPFDDVAVLILSQDVAGGHQRKMSGAAVIDGAASLTVAGYGNSDIVGWYGAGKRRYVSVILASTNCSGDAPDRYGCDRGAEIVSSPCGEKGACTGDSGGPAYVLDSGQWLLAGVISRPIKDASQPCGDATVFGRIDRVEAWVRSVPGGHW